MLPFRGRTVINGHRWQPIIALAALTILAGGGLAQAADRFTSSGSAVSKSLRGDRQSTRFVIGLSRKADFQVFSLNNPNRVIVDLPRMRMRLPPAPRNGPVGLIRSFRGGQSAPGRSRVVIHVTRPVVVQRAVMRRTRNRQHARLVIDIVPAAHVIRMAAMRRTKVRSKPSTRYAKARLRSSSVQPPLPRAAVRPEVIAAKTHKHVIVLDPGHGGHDSGAKKHGTVEKNVVLAFGKMLREKLKDRYKVLMTRDDDTFVPLDERRAFAERNKAALFIAIHADYARASARGATIYSLRENVARSLKRAARKSVRKSVLSGAELRPIKASASPGFVKGWLADLAQREVEANGDRTSVFARSVIQYMKRSTQLKQKPDRKAAFAVLKTAKVPAVLIELAYVSNKRDARNLRSQAWREKVSKSIMTAIDNYFSHKAARVPL